MGRNKDQEAKGAVELIEEAFQILRTRPLDVLPAYLVGVLPFILGFLFFWGDMSRNAYGADYCAPAALGIALLFSWMKCWQALFLRKIRDRISPGGGFPWTLSRAARLIASQTLFHAAGLFLLPAALILSAPFGWAYAFFQNGSAVQNEEDLDLRNQCKNAWKLAKLWPVQNHVLLALLSLFGVFVFLNLAIAMLVLPGLFKVFYGVDTLVSMSFESYFNTTFLAVLFGMTYICMDPLIKTVYLLRCFYGRSARTGEDLRTELKRLSRKALVVLPLVLVLWGPADLSRAENPPLDPPSASTASELHGVSPQALNRAIDEVLRDRRFTWRMPNQIKPEKEPDGPIASLLNWMREKLEWMADTLVEWMETVADWFDKLFPAPAKNPREEKKTDWMVSTQGLLYVLVGLTAILLGGFAWWVWKNRSRTPKAETSNSSVPTAPDAADETIRADDFPADRWRHLAKELLERGDYRMALRAIYLGTLSHLAEYSLITIAKHKSNREYETELFRRAHDRQEMTRRFSEDVIRFDAAWYGMREVTLGEFERFAESQWRIMTLARR